MHPIERTIQLAAGATPLDNAVILSSPSIRLGVVETFVPGHVGLACQPLATDVAYRKRVV